MEGILNTGFTSYSDGLEYEHVGAQDIYEEKDWTHSVMCFDGCFFCPGAGGQTPIADLWLSAEGQPDSTRGYMSRIDGVYKFMPKQAQVNYNRIGICCC